MLRVSDWDPTIPDFQTCSYRQIFTFALLVPTVQMDYHKISSKDRTKYTLGPTLFFELIEALLK